MHTQHSNIIRINQTTNDNQKKRKRKLNIRKVLVLLCIVWAGYTYFFVQRPHLQALKQEHLELTQKLNDIHQNNSQLKQSIQKLNQDSYIAEIARKKYNLKNPGDITLDAP